MKCPRDGLRRCTMDDNSELLFPSETVASNESSDSSSEEEESPIISEPEQRNTADLTWPQYFLYKGKVAGYKTYKACEYLGETLAWFFGITTPRNSYVTDAWELQQLEDKLEKEREDKLIEEAQRKEAERMAAMEGQVDRANDDNNVSSFN